MQDNKKENNSSSGGGLSWTSSSASSATKEAPKQKMLSQGAVTSDIPRLVGAFAGGIIIGVILSWGIAALRTPVEAPVAVPGTATTTTTTQETDATLTEAGVVEQPDEATAAPATPASNNVLVVSSPQAPGPLVVIDRAVVTQPTWVVVYEINSAGERGNALGARLFFAGETSNSVRLLRNTRAGEQYLVGLQLDNGDRIYSLHGDAMINDASGNPLRTIFEAR